MKTAETHKNNPVLQKKENAKSNKESFFGASDRTPFFQPKLTVNAPGDAYEVEADAVAEKVMRMPVGTSFFPQSITNHPIPVTTIPRKCSHCEEEEKLQRKEDEKSEEEIISGKHIADLPVERKCTACEHEEKIQRKPDELPEEEKIQRRGSSEAESTYDTTSVENTLRGSGHALDNGTLDFMESRFGYDFSNVQIHTDVHASKSSADINALAYTHQNHIVFGEGQYQPGTDSGKQLLAHELAHVVQQTGGTSLQKKEDTIQRAYWVGVDRTGKEMTGTKLHTKILGDLGKDKGNSDLFIEAPVPNADLLSEGYDKIGIADLYKGSTTVGAYFKGHFSPSPLGASSKLKKGGAKYSHDSLAKPSVFAMDNIDLTGAPGSIQLGDLKPYGAVELDPKYEEQISNYKKGYEKASTEINQMAGDPVQKDRLKPKAATWSPSVTTLGQSDVQIPDEYKIGSASVPSVKMLLKDGSKKYFTDGSVTGKMYVAYRKDQSGIWNYVWVPDPPLTAANLPQSVAGMQVDLKLLLDPLNDTRIQPKLKSDGSLSKKVQRETPKAKKDNFDFPAWKTKHEGFVKKFKAVPEADVKEATGKVEGQKLNKELHNKFSLPGSATETETEKKNVKHVKQLKFWSHPQTVIVGKIRQVFGGLYVKVNNAIEGIKNKTKKLVSTAQHKISQSGLVGAVIKLFLKIFKFVGKLMLDKTIDLVITSIREGVSKKVNDFIDSLIPEEAEQEIEKLKAIQKEFEEKAMANVEALMDKLSPYLKIFDVLKKIEEAAAVANTIISIIRWGARLLACASPPAVGCLWALAQSVLEGFAAMVIQSCWFTKKAGPPVAALLAKVDPVVSLPNTAAKFIIENVNELMPGGWKDTFPLPPSSALGQLVPQYDGSCDEEPERFNPERQEMYALIEEIGEEKFLAFMKMMDKGGAGPWVLLTPDRLRKIKDDLKAAKIEDIKKMTEGQKPENPETVKLEEFLKEISKYTKKETETRDKFF